MVCFFISGHVKHGFCSGLGVPETSPPRSFGRDGRAACSLRALVVSVKYINAACKHNQCTPAATHGPESEPTGAAKL